MRRWILNIFCILSLMVFGLSVSIWVFSYFATADIERFSRQTDPSQHSPLTRTLGYGIGWAPGKLGIFHYRGESSVPATSVRTWIYREFGPTRRLITPATPDDRVNLQVGNFQLLNRVETSADRRLSLRLLVLPFWVFLFAAIPPVIWWRRWRRAHSPGKKKAGGEDRCEKCTKPPLIFALACCILATRPVSAAISLDASFDSASLKSYSASGNTINLVGRDNYYGSGHWRWLYFQASGVQNTTPTFSIRGDLFAGDSTPGPHELSEHEMVYSYDGANWSFFDNNVLTPTPPTPPASLPNPTLFNFSNNSAFTQNSVYVAYALVYPYSKSVAHSQAVLASPWAAPTASGNASGIIGQSPTGTDDLGRAVPALNMYAYRITNPATDSPTVAKRKLMISSSLHAGETLGTYTYEGLVNWLISDDPRAARLRDVAEVLCYPELNPAGRYAGNSRTTVRNVNVDPNGLWDSTRWQNNSSAGCSGTTNCQDIRVSGTAMNTDVQATPGYLDAFIDFHSTVPDYTIDPTPDPDHQGWGRPDDFTYVNPDDVNRDWFVNLHALQPNLLTYQSTSGSYTTTGYARRILDKRAAGVTTGRVAEITLETAFSWERNVDYYHDLGTKVGIAFYEAWGPQVDGDYTGDGVVDAADYVVWRKTGINGPTGYDTWRTNFGEPGGSGSGAGANATVPEPATMVMLMFAAAGWCVRRCRAA